MTDDEEDYGLLDGVVIDLTQDVPTSPIQMPVGTAPTVIGTPTGLATASRTMSFKRLAWAFGCSPKGSDEERQLAGLLLQRARQRACECGEEVDCSGWRCGRCGKEHA